MLLIVLIFAAAPAGLALAAALKTSGWKKIYTWSIFVMLALPLAVGGIGTAVLSAYGLAWRTAVKGPCVFVYCIGLLGLALWASACTFQYTGAGRSILGLLFSLLVLGAVSFVWIWYMFFGAVWMGNDSEVTRDGKILVEECGFMCDVDYYAYRGPLVRGREIIRRGCT